MAQHSKAGSANLTTVAEYRYDIRNLRVTAIKTGVTSYCQYDLNGNLIWSESANRATKYIYALGMIWAEVRTVALESTTYYHHTDYTETKVVDPL